MPFETVLFYSRFWILWNAQVYRVMDKRWRGLIYPKPFILIVYLDGFWCCFSYCISHFSECVAAVKMVATRERLFVCAFGTQA